ncbi:heavy metal sensor histidine kinase [Serratia quinivorans]|uniref:heavy metal sensor histidine kinase n=1 Tax=Serratia quinivorans TaxID=137545 RepID=UPI00217A9D72|nr:heavy metal sensor histidine kinase [Serratia quinivorans]CAI0955224.1 Sensor kinase CusS [Serratia quinivorans]CAI1759111.1 Sensor kinase CusS [Serratia quinivorans]
MSHFKTMSLRLRLALMFSAASAVLLAVMGIYVYSALNKEIAYRDDIALLGRIEQMKVLISSYENIDDLRRQPQLYANMLGNKENILWVINERGDTLIEINPTHIVLPPLPNGTAPLLFDHHGNQAARLAGMSMEYRQGTLTLIAGKLLAERRQMMAAYRVNIGFAWLVGVYMAFILGWVVVRRGLMPLKQLSQHASSIAPRNLNIRLDQERQPHELQDLTKALNLMLERLDEGYTRLSRFSEDLAHEMRTPLNNLMIQNQLALNLPRDAQHYENLLVSKQEEYERLNRMIENMLFIARAEKTESILCLQPVLLAEMAEQLGEYFEGMAEERNIRIQSHMQDILIADSALLRRALANLLANALRYGAANSVVTLSSHVHAQGMNIEVANKGEAIAPEHLLHLFERFYRCDASRSQPGDSGGLGLAIVQSIMQMHNGQITVESSLQGTTFTLQFPFLVATSRPEKPTVRE